MHRSACKATLALTQIELVVFIGSPGSDAQAGPGEAAVDQLGPVLDLLGLALDDADSPSRPAASKLAIARLSSDQIPPPD